MYIPFPPLPARTASRLFFHSLVLTLAFATLWQYAGAQSLQLTANTQWVNLGDLDVPGNQITVEALINRQSGVNVVSKHTDPGNVNYLLRPTTFEITTGGNFHLMTNPYSLQNNTWYHIAGVYNGSTITYYVNGCPVIQQPASGNMAQQNLSTAIGNISTSPYAEQFIGLIDEVRIWNIARTQAEIAANMNDLPNPTTYPNLLAYYKFSNNLLNSASASFNGTAVGPVSYGPEPPVIAPFSITSVVPANVTCYGLNNGSVTITAAGNGVQYSLDGTTYQTGNTFTNLSPGNYTAYVRSQEGCVLSQTFSITQPAQLTGTFSATICAGQTYSFAGNTYSSAGTYSVVNPGSTGCDSTSTLQLAVTASSGPPPPASHFNTGTNGSGGTLPGGSPDATWQVAVNNINGVYNPALVMTSIPGNYYSSPWVDCRWISHNANGTETGQNTYFYRAQFDLPCFNTCGQSYADDGVFCLNLDFLADNAVMEIFINGVPQSANIPNVPPPTNPNTYTGFQQPNMISTPFCTDWQPGTNTIIIQVQSGGGYAGFLAQASVNTPPASVSDTVEAAICSGQTYTFGGNTYNATGHYNHTFQTAAGCDSVVMLDLTVNPTPAQPVINSNSPVCEGASITLNTPTVASATYNWNGPGSWSSTAQNPSLPGADAAMAGNYTLSVTVNGCVSPTATANVTVNPLPAAPAVSSNSPLCEGGTLLLTATGAAGSQPVWNGPGAWTSGVQNPQLPNLTTAQSGTYSLYVVVSGCTSATAGTNVTVNPKPSVQYTGALSFCGTTALLSASGNVQAPGAITSYDWYAPPGGGSIGSGTLFAHNFSSVNPTTQQTVAVIASTGDGCSDTATAALMLYASPNTDFEWEDLCKGSDVQFTDVSDWNGNPQAGGLFTYNWDFGDGQGGTTAAPLHAYADTGTYSVTLITGSTESSCADTVTYTITVHPKINVVPGIEPDACGQGVSFHAQLDPAGVASSLHWDLGDGTTSADSAFHHVYQQTGTFNISLTAETDYQCTFTGTGNVVIVPSPSISTVPLPNIITPNGDAVNNALILDELFADCVEYELKIMNRWGNLVYKQHKGSAPFAGTGPFGARLSAGVYYFVITSGKEEKTGTITVAY